VGYVPAAAVRTVVIPATNIATATRIDTKMRLVDMRSLLLVRG
jgi:hypothetical protein